MEKAGGLELETTGGLQSTYIKSVTPNAIEHMPEELIQLIQYHLPVNKGARTAVLSKSWRHAWSTNPNLRFHLSGEKSLKFVDRTLTRYLRENLLIEKVKLEIDITNWKFSPAEKLIWLIATKTCLKEFSLSVMCSYSSYGNNFTLSDDLLLGENLTKIRVQGAGKGEVNCVKMMTSLHPVIKCVSLQELDLVGVRISEAALNHIFSSCTLLVKIRLRKIVLCSKKFKNIKVKNLPRLYELHVGFYSWYSYPDLEISDVPNLRVFRYEINSDGTDPLPFNAKAYSMSLSNNLTLSLDTWKFESFHFTCASIKRISLDLCAYKYKKISDVQIYAPKLLSFSFSGYDHPDLLFPVSSLTQIELSFRLRHPFDVSFFVKLREALTLSPKCNICIITYKMPLDIDIDDLRRRLLFPPATNVQQLDFGVVYENDPRERSPFFDALFEICHPKHVIARPRDIYIPVSEQGFFLEKNNFCWLMPREVLEKKKTTGISCRTVDVLRLYPLAAPSSPTTCQDVLVNLLKWSTQEIYDLLSHQICCTICKASYIDENPMGSKQIQELHANPMGEPMVYRHIDYPSRNSSEWLRWRDIVTIERRREEEAEEATSRMAEGWTTVNRSSLRSRLQEAEERLSQALSQINVLEAQISCLRAEQSQLTKSHEHHVSLLLEEIRELKAKHKKLLAHQHQEIECEKAGLESTIVPEHIPEELIQLIQSHLSVKEAARTTVLSKSWRHAWSTNPTLRFRVRGKKSMKLVDRSLKRYLRDNISIEKLDLKIDTMNWKPASRAEKCIWLVATKTCIKEFSLFVTFHDWDSHFMLPDELLLGEKLTKIRVQGAGRREDNSVKMMTSLHPVIKCVSLQELHLNRVDISEEALNHILSSCTLLVKVELINLDSWSWIGFKKTIKVKNLPRLQELHIAFNTWYSPALEISDVPNLHVFRYNINGYGIYPSDRYLMVPDRLPFNTNAHSMSLSNVRELELGGVVPNYACLDMITSELPFLESLTLDLETWELESFHFTCASIRRISLVSHVHDDPSDVQIFAPKLLSFSFTGYDILPNLLFPVSSLRKIETEEHLFLRCSHAKELMAKLQAWWDQMPNLDHINSIDDLLNFNKSRKEAAKYEVVCSSFLWSV
ncbi:hypothetical protein LXL04_006982 [Taraxacum kok-saghyz]